MKPVKNFTGHLLLQTYTTEFQVRYKSFTLFIDEIVESEDCISYSGRSVTPHYRWRQEGKEGFFRIVDKFKQVVDVYIERNND